MRRLLLTLAAAFALGALAQPADAQIRFGVQGAVLTGLEDLTGTPGGFDLNGTYGFGARGALQPPLLPVGLVGQAVYYLPDGEGTYVTYSLGAQLRLPLVLVSPYAIAGWQWRRADEGGTGSVATTESGPMIGVGVQFNLAVALFLEATFEFNDEIAGATDFDNNPLVIKGGFMFG